MSEKSAFGASTEKTWRGVAWRNERVHAAFLLWGRDAGELRATVAPLTGPGGAKIDARVRWIDETLASDFFEGVYDPVKWPSRPVGDILDDAQPFALNDRGFRSVWVSCRTPAETPAGLYRGEFVVTSPGGRIAFPLELTVLKACLPKEKKFHLDIWQTPWTVARYYGVKPFSKEHYVRLEPIFRELADAGQKTITTTITDYPWNVRPNIDSARSMVRYVRRRDGSWHADFSVMDEYVAFAERCGLGPQIHCYSLVKFQRHRDYQFFDEATGKEASLEFDVGSPEYEAYWGPLLRQLTEHAREKGWIGRLYVAMDELPPADVAAAGAILARHAPGVKLQMAGDKAPSSFKDVVIDSYSKGLHEPASFDEEFSKEAAARRSAGYLTTAYVCCAPRRPNALVMSPLVEQRWIGLFLAAFRLDGFLKSTSHRWTPSLDPRVDSHCLPEFPCGDSFLLYPGPLASPRWESLVDGFEDWEKIRLARESGRMTPELAAALDRIKPGRFLKSDEKTVREDVASVLAALNAAMDM